MSHSSLYASPEHAGGVDQADTSEIYQPRIFSTNGRIGRIRYLAYSSIYNVLMLLVVAIAGIFLALGTGGEDLSESTVLLMVMGLFYVPFLASFFIVAKRRLNDLNASGWLGLLMLVPLINVVFGLYLLFGPGSPGTNHYGVKPAPNSRALVIFGFAIPVLFVLLGIVAAVTIPAYQDYQNKVAEVSASQSPQY